MARIFIAGASGVIGVRLVPLLVAANHDVAGMTRSAEKLAALEALGAAGVLCDVYDAGALRDAVIAFRPDVVVHQLTDLPDDLEELAASMERNDRMRTEGTGNLLAAARAAGAPRLLVQSIAWELPPGRGETVAAHERATLEAGGIVIRYGRLYGPGTYYEGGLPEPPRVSVDDAARRTVPLLDAEPGVVDITDS